MNSLILRTATRFLLTLLLLFSIFLLLRGHNEPGGGFVGGLVAASGFVLYAVGYGTHEARRALGFDTRTFIGAGLLIAIASTLVAPLRGLPFMTGVWGAIPVAADAVLELGTPVVFDVGVYLAVIGVALTVILAMAEEQ